MRRVRRGVFLLATAATLMGSSAQTTRAEGATVYRDLSPHARVEATALTSSVALGSALAADPELLSEVLEEARYDPSPEFLPGGGEAEALVWNQTANWMVAVNEDGEPVYLPSDNFEYLEVVTMGSLAERFEHFEGLREQLPGETPGEKIKNDETTLLLGNYYDAELRDDLATVIRHELFGVPAAGYEESLKQVNEHFGRDDDEPSFFGRAAEEAAEEAEREVEREVDRGIDDAIDIIVGGLGER